MVRESDRRGLQSEPDFGEAAAATLARMRAGTIPPAELAARYLPRLRAFVHARLGAGLRRVESESDIVQSVCRELCEEPSGRAFNVEAEFRAWLFAVATNKIRERARYWDREKRSPEQVQFVDRDTDLEALRCLSASLTPSREAASREELERVERALEALSEDDRRVIALSRIAALPHAVVGEHLGRSEEAARKMLGRALRRLSAALLAMKNGTGSAAIGEGDGG